MFVKIWYFSMAICLLSSGASCSENAVNIILGGSWFSKSTIGTSGNYLMADWREKIFIPLVTRMAQKVLENMQTVNDLHWMILGLVLWNSVLSVVFFYKTIKNCRRQNM